MKADYEKAYERGRLIRQQQGARCDKLTRGEKLNRRESLAYVNYFPTETERQRACFEVRSLLAASVVKEVLRPAQP